MKGKLIINFSFDYNPNGINKKECGFCTLAAICNRDFTFPPIIISKGK